MSQMGDFWQAGVRGDNKGVLSGVRRTFEAGGSMGGDGDEKGNQDNGHEQPRQDNAASQFRSSLDIVPF